MPETYYLHAQYNLHYLTMMLENPQINTLTCVFNQVGHAAVGVSAVVCTNIQREPLHITHEGDGSLPLPWFQARYRREPAQKNVPSLPLVENLLKDNTDGCALAALLHFYCPQAVRLEGGCPDIHIFLLFDLFFIKVHRLCKTRHPIRKYMNDL